MSLDTHPQLFLLIVLKKGNFLSQNKRKRGKADIHHRMTGETCILSETKRILQAAGKTRVCPYCHTDEDHWGRLQPHRRAASD